MSLKPVIGVGGGIGTTINLGASKIVPIQNPAEDELYIYSPNNQSQTQGLFEVFAGLEQTLYPKWSVHYGLAYEQTGTYHAQGVFVQGADPGSSNEYTSQYNVVGRTLLAQSKWIYSYGNHFYPYILVGLGASFNSASSYLTSTPGFLTFTREYSDKDSSDFAYRLGLGVDMDITKHTQVGIAYRFADLGHVALGTATIDSILVPGTLSQSNLYLNEMLIQLSYIF
jgi:opacity protein-like surface antigen